MKIARDKIKHFIISVIGATGITLLLLIFISIFPATIYGSLVMLVIGIGYEFYQKFTGKGCFEVKDMLADLLGCFTSFLTLNIFYVIYLITLLL